MEIKRPLYLDRLVDRIENGMIKIVTGMRRSGKSYLLNNLFSDYLINQGVSTSNIIKIPLDNFEFRKFRVVFQRVCQLPPDTLFETLPKAHLFLTFNYIRRLVFQNLKTQPRVFCD